MARPHVTVRDAVPDDLADLVAMWGELRSAAGRVDRSTPHESEHGVLARLKKVHEDPSMRVLVASRDGQVCGMALVTVAPVMPLVEAKAASVHYLHVRPACRRRGVGRALIAAAAAWAEDCGAEQVVAALPTSEREANRFLARLGFGQAVVRRTVPTAALRRRVGPDPRAAIVDDAVRRRALRRMRTAMTRPIGQ